MTRSALGSATALTPATSWRVSIAPPGIASAFAIVSPRADRGDPVGRLDGLAVDEHALVAGGERRARDQPHVVHRDGLRAGVAQLLHGVDEQVLRDQAVRVGDREHRPVALDGTMPASIAQVVVRRWRLRSASSSRSAELSNSSRVRRSSVISDWRRSDCADSSDEDAGEVLLALGGQPVADLLGRADLRDEQEAEQPAGERDRDPQPTAARAARGRPPRAAGLGVDGGSWRVDRPVMSAARSPRTLQARKITRRTAARLEKIRTPSTTTTAVDSSLPTPSWSPR
jgi:hypothetical protein